ncbi:riboflavin biosynthesis protein RibF [Lactobacillus sp. PV034]|uniref:riboflavin biosynthesis protein RibF n=1 Tax=Lactobacillus sp. PV034 TaxID=2594495 RepID=UPI00223ED97F|nr:riboflavin biosynthesis protein RibF [Lactobacillus sp. PV034]QNQ80337.1 riboflavin biosynthesis protein RibF [Lactobacillus sp. PV034]
MKVVSIKYPIKEKPVKDKIVLALGFFDGLHRGHQALIKHAKEIATKKGLPLGVMTFNRHPKEIYQNDKTFVYLNTLKEKEEKLAKMNVDYLLVVDFDKNFSKLKPQEFIDKVLLKLNIDTAVVGFDYTYGPKDVANIENLPKFVKGRFDIVVEPKHMDGGEKVGSTVIRNAIETGKIELANKLLGEPYTTSGIIVRGYRRGHQIGFPTANLQVEGDKVIPAEGVYATRTLIDGQWYDSMTSVGYNDTFENKELTIETHLFGFDEEAYGKAMTIAWYKFIRGNIKFAGIPELRAQLEKDQANIQAYFHNLEKNK